MKHSLILPLALCSEGSDGPAKTDLVKVKEEPAGDEEANEGKSESVEGGEGAEKGEGNDSDEAKKALQKKTKDAKPVCGMEDGLHMHACTYKDKVFFPLYFCLFYFQQVY